MVRVGVRDIRRLKSAGSGLSSAWVRGYEGL